MAAQPADDDPPPFQIAAASGTPTPRAPADRFILALPSATRLASELIRWIGIIWVAHYAVPIAQAFAGKSTTASFLLDLMANTSVRDILFGLFGVTGTAYGIGTSHVYRKRITALSTQIKHLENQHDPGRSSSGLTSSEDGPTL